MLSDDKKEELKKQLIPILTAPEAKKPLVAVDTTFKDKLNAALQGQPLSRMDAPRRFADRSAAFQLGQDELGSQDLGLGARFDLSLSDTFEEKKAKFLNKFPEGDLLRLEDELLFRRDGNEPFAAVDKGFFTDFEPLGDLADFGGDAPAIAGEVLAAYLSSGTSALAQAGAFFLGGAGGELTKEGIEALRGFSLEELEEFGGRAGLIGATSVLGEGVGRGIAKTFNVLRGIPVGQSLPQGRAARIASDRLGSPPLRAFQISDNPILAKLAGQSGAVTPTIPRWVQEQRNSLVRFVKNMGDKMVGKTLKDELTDIYKLATQDLAKVLGASKKELSEAGLTLEQAVAQWTDVSDAAVNRAYAKAREIEGAEFDLTPARQVAEEILLGTPSRDAAGNTINLAPPSDQLKLLATQVKEAVPEDLTAFGVDITAVEQLRALRKSAWDLKQPALGQAPGRRTREQAQASKIMAAIDHVLKNPKNSNPEFVKVWSEANSLARGRFDILEKAIITKVGRDGNPSELAFQLAKPRQAENIRTLKLVVDDKAFRDFQDASIGTLTKDIRKFPAELAKLDDETAEVLFGSRLKDVRFAAKQAEKLNASGIDRALERQTKTAGLVKDLIVRGDTAGIDALAKTVKPDSRAGKALRAGLIDDIAGRVIRKNREGVFVDNQILAAEIKRLKDTGASKFFTFQDLRRLKDLELVAQFLQRQTDSGTSLQAGEAVAGLRGLEASAALTLLEAIGTGRLLTSKAGDRFLQGTIEGQARKPITLRGYGAVLATIAAEFDSEDE